MEKSTPSTLQIISRVAASLFGGYVFVWGFLTLGVAACVALGMNYNDAQQLCYLLAFLMFLVCFCWAFVARSLALVWAVLAFGGLLMTVAGWLLAQAIV